MSEKTWLFAKSEEGNEYIITKWYRCAGIGIFCEQVEKENAIAGLIIDGNNIGFILDEPESGAKDD